MKFYAKFYDEKTGRLLEEVAVHGQPIHAGERIPNVSNVAVALVTRVDPKQPKPVRPSGRPIQKVWVRDWFGKS